MLDLAGSTLSGGLHRGALDDHACGHMLPECNQELSGQWPGLPDRSPPSSVSSASTRAASGARPGATMALRTLCSQLQAV